MTRLQDICLMMFFELVSRIRIHQSINIPVFLTSMI